MKLANLVIFSLFCNALLFGENIEDEVKREADEIRASLKELREKEIAVQNKSEIDAKKREVESSREEARRMERELETLHQAPRPAALSSEPILAPAADQLYVTSTPTKGYERKFAISFSPISLLFGQMDMRFQIKLLDFLSLTFPMLVGFNYIHPLSYGQALLKGNASDYETTALPLSLEGGIGLKLSTANNGLADSFFIEPRVTVNYWQLGVKNSYGKEFSWDVMGVKSMMLIGWDWYYDSGFMMSLAGGVGYQKNLGGEVYLSQGIAVSKEMARNIPDPNRHGEIDKMLEFKTGFVW